MSSGHTSYGYMSDYEDFGSRARLRASRQCGHYPKMGGLPCPACTDKALAEAYRKGAQDMKRALRGVKRRVSA